MPVRARGTLAVAASCVSLLLAPISVRADQTTATTSSHVVQTGETLSQIAVDAGVDAAALASLNGLDDANLIVAGQTLKLPSGKAAAPVTGVTTAPAAAGYTVAEGDTLWGIAHKLNTTTDALTELNKLDDSGHLSIGMLLSLPGGAASAATQVPVASPSAMPSPSAAPVAVAVPAPARRSLLVSYTVQAGETLNQIARQFDVRADTIVQASGLDDPNKLPLGTVLKVPVPGKEHVVSAGETLRDIALAEKVDLGSLIDFNQLDDPELIRVGQVVLVPVPASQQAATAATPTPSTATPFPAAPTPQATPAPAKTPAPAGAVARPAAPVATPPTGAPSDGLAGAGLKFLGAAYVFGGSSPSGFDCSGFVWYVARQIGKPLSRGMFGEYNSGSHPAREELKAGDLVFFQNTYSPGLSHNGIYIGNGQFVHAADEAAGVTISSLNVAYWSSHWFGATRLP